MACSYWSTFLELNQTVYGNQPLRVYKAQPHTSANVGMVRVAGFDPAASWFRTRRSTKLSYTLYWRPLRGTIPPHVMDSDAASPDA